MKRTLFPSEVISRILEGCDKALLKEPGNVEMLKARGIAFNLAEKYVEAIDDFTKVLKVSPEDVSTYYLKSDCHYQLGEYERTKQDFMRAVLLEDNPGIEKKYIDNVIVPEENELNDIVKILEFEKNKAILKNFPDLISDSTID